jgi:hypothetical protein
MVIERLTIYWHGDGEDTMLFMVSFLPLMAT